MSGCVLGGGQFYQDLTTNGQSALAQSPSLDLKYDYKFPVGFDFGAKTAGKMPGLWGGGVPGCESGAQHCAEGWSTRYMWQRRQLAARPAASCTSTPRPAPGSVPICAWGTGPSPRTASGTRSSS